MCTKTISIYGNWNNGVISSFIQREDTTMNAKSTVRFIIKCGLVLGKIMIEREMKMSKIWKV